MKSFIKWLSQEAVKPSQTEEELYLSRATSLADLERRQKAVMYGQAPWQTLYRNKMLGETSWN